MGSPVEALLAKPFTSAGKGVEGTPHGWGTDLKCCPRTALVPGQPGEVGAEGCAGQRDKDMKG